MAFVLTVYSGCILFCHFRETLGDGSFSEWCTFIRNTKCWRRYLGKFTELQMNSGLVLRTTHSVPVLPVDDLMC